MLHLAGIGGQAAPLQYLMQYIQPLLHLEEVVHLSLQNQPQFHLSWCNPRAGCHCYTAVLWQMCYLTAPDVPLLGRPLGRLAQLLAVVQLM